jgi:DNA invertase Pin-like site-specific DNA recombinase
MMISKIADRHLSREACIYIRQSTMGQVRFNQESTERQYNLASKAQSLGWSSQRIRILDRDLGQSGARTTNREDFKTLVSDVAMSQVGAIFSLEASRLARSNQDWHRLLELCAITGTLVINEDGCYDPAEFNDGLVLGMKGTFAQAELHIIRARLHGGKINKAHKGELHFALPVGFVFDNDKTALDPDQEVQGAVRTVFELFERESSAYAVVRRFQELGLRFPRRSYGGAWDGKLLWGRLTHSRVLGILANPSYAGTYVFGRYQACKQIGPAGEIRTQSRLMPQDEWRVVIPGHHPGYITWDQFLANSASSSSSRCIASFQRFSSVLVPSPPCTMTMRSSHCSTATTSQAQPANPSRRQRLTGNRTNCEVLTGPASLNLTRRDILPTLTATLTTIAFDDSSLQRAQANRR